MSPRDLAFEVLSRWSEPSGQATQALEERLAAANLSASERGLALELVYGVIRRRATLDALLQAHVQRSLEKVETGALCLLRLGAYQLVFLSGAPAYAVVNETAELAKRLGRPQWTGFVNGVLRSVGRALTDEYVTAPAANAVPLADGRFRVVRGKTFPDPALDYTGYFAAAFSFPHWLAERWRRRFTPAELTRLGFWFDAPPKLTLRVNPLKTSRADFLDELKTAGVAASAGEHPAAVRLEHSARVSELPGFHQGWFVVQDESAMSAATLLAPRPGERVLDLCAAPGGKSTHLATLMRNEGSIVAADVDPARLALVTENCRRLELSIVETLVVQRNLDDLPQGPFDAVLMDVPCSNTGVLGKRPEVRWRIQPADITELAELQRRLLHEALTRLSPTGRLLYSTCSIEPEENHDLVAAVLSTHPAWKIAEERFHTPGQPADGGYQALIVPVQG
ncbi:MAG TPA: 16S rRNA (cytosine(967)-C(5))-methyltransferase RsmB [Planctomycetaceae bacterium]|nr:16S rRNA (cytosine(967)-C(5))-methyltransferase RsmB [Planctomycetaceae bacterium]